MSTYNSLNFLYILNLARDNEIYIETVYSILTLVAQFFSLKFIDKV